jgi:outer membrane lipoprotein SlyB
LDAAVYNHTINPADAANVMQIAREAAGNQSHGLLSASSIANAAVGYGLGNIAARGLGAVATTLFGFPPQQQLQLARGAGIAGALYNVLGGLAP